MAGIKIVDLPALGRDLLSTDLLEMSIGGTASRKITGQEIMNASKLNVGSTPIVSGTVGRVLFQGTGNVLQQSSSLFWDGTNNRLGIGTDTPLFPLDVLGTAKFASATSGMIIRDWTAFNTFRAIYKASETPSNTNYLMAFDTDVLLNSRGSGTDIYYNGSIRARFGNAFALRVIGSGTTTATVGMEVTSSANTNLFQIRDNGAVLINTTTDAGFRLDVNGTARVSGTLTLNNTSGTNRSTDIRLTNSIDNFPAATFYPASGTNVGQNFQIIPRGTGLSANVKAQFVLSGTDTIADGTNFEAMVIRATGAAFTLISGKGGTGTIRPLLLSSGFLDGSTNPNQLWLYSTGNIGINTTTDAGFRLDVNGTARVVNLITGTGGLTISGSNTGISTSTTFINNISMTTSGFGTTGYGMAIDGGFRWGINAGNSYKFGHWAGLNGAYNWNNASASVIEVGMGATTPNINNITWTSVNITPTFNADFSSRSGNIIRGVYYNPTITSLVNGVRNQLRAFESSFGGAYFNTTSVDGSSILQADSTTQGFLPPRMTNAQRTAIVSPAVGLIVYCTDVTEGLWVYKSTGWTFIV